MDIKTLIKKLDISWIKVLTLSIFDNAGLYEYALDKANTAVNLLLAAHKDTIAAIRDKLATLYAKLIRYAEYLPAPWTPGPAVRTNGVWRTYWGEAAGGAGRDHGFLIAIPVRTEITTPDGEQIAPPSENILPYLMED